MNKKQEWNPMDDIIEKLGKVLGVPTSSLCNDKKTTSLDYSVKDEIGIKVDFVKGIK